MKVRNPTEQLLEKLGFTHTEFSRQPSDAVRSSCDKSPRYSSMRVLQWPNRTPATKTNKGSANRQSPFFMPPVITRETEAPGTETPGISGCALQIKGASGRSGNLADFVYHVPKSVVLIIDYFSFGSVTLPNENDRDRCRSDEGGSDFPAALRTW